MTKFKHEINDKGQHRIQHTSIADVHSEWVGYQIPAVLVDEGHTYLAFTQYYAGLEGLKTETVIEASPLPKKDEYVIVADGPKDSKLYLRQTGLCVAWADNFNKATKYSRTKALRVFESLDTREGIRLEEVK